MPRIDNTLDLASGYLAGFTVAGSKDQDSIRGALRVVSVQGHAVWTQDTFERLMDRVLQGLRWSRCLVYLDDIISFGNTYGDVLDNLTLIFERLRAYGLQLKSTKCSSRRYRFGAYRW